MGNSIFTPFKEGAVSRTVFCLAVAHPFTMADISERLEQAQSEAESMKDEIRKNREAKADTTRKCLTKILGWQSAFDVFIASVNLTVLLPFSYRGIVCFFRLSVHAVQDHTKSLAAAPRCSLKVRRTLKGHLAKIYALHWSEVNKLRFCYAMFDMEYRFLLVL